MRIMVCYDETEPSKRAVQQAITQAEAFEAEVFIVTSLVKGNVDNQEEINLSKKRLDAVHSMLKDKGLRCQADLLIHGLAPGEDLVLFATEKEIDIAIIGIVKKSKIGKLFFGSTAQHLILNAPCPVLTVK